MKAQPLIKTGPGLYEQCGPGEANFLRIRIPGPAGFQTLPIITRGTRAGTGAWTWNGSVDAPTLRPSVAVNGFFCADDENGERDEPFACHSWINDGKVQFLSDCTHEFAGQTLDLLDL